jgi:hypothetical protein
MMPSSPSLVSPTNAKAEHDYTIIDADGNEIPGAIKVFEKAAAGSCTAKAVLEEVNFIKNVLFPPLMWFNLDG